MALPIEAILPDLLSALAATPSAVLIAPPGAGKTTMVAPALLREAWCTGEIWLLSPRRIAARAAAERIAQLIGQPVGQSVGYATRLDSRRSDATRLLVVTEGIFRNRVIADPELRGVSAVLFDEAHERSLDGDFGLALAMEAQAAFRPDLRILPMSATLDGAGFAALLGDVPLLVSQGVSHPLQIDYLGRAAGVRIEEAMAPAIRHALDSAEGDLLAFLPGVREIDATARALGPVPGCAILPLHGSLDPAEQRRVLAPDRVGQRKIILATSIAETSLTIDGVRIVIDSGLARRPRFDQAAGIGRLVTERVSIAAATQRAGRAARQGPGRAFRLWEQAAEGGMPRFDTPEILESDLSALVLDCALFGEADPLRLRWIDPPPAPAIAEACARLMAIGAIDADGRVTPHGRAIAALPLPPRLGHMMLVAARDGQARRAAELAVLLQERGIGGGGTDLEQRLARFGGSGPRGRAAMTLARRLAHLADEAAPATAARTLSAGEMIAIAFPERLAKRRGAEGTDWIAAGGRGFRLDPADPLARSEWLAIADAAGAAGGARILAAAPLSAVEVETLFAASIERVATIAYDRAADRIAARQERRLGAIVLGSGPLERPDPAMVADALVHAVARHGLHLLPWSEASIALRRRAAFAGVTILLDEALLADVPLWLRPLLGECRSLSAIDRGALHRAIEDLLDWPTRQRIEQVAPAHFTSPLGSAHAIDYGAAAGPTVSLRVQALYGIAEHPVVGRERIPLVLELLSPAQRPIQVTRDLPAFWTGSWREVAKEMRGAYPRHDWPDDPAAAIPSLRTKRAQARHGP